MRLWQYIREKLLEHPEQTLCEGNAAITYEEICIFAEERAKELTAPYYGIFCNSELAAAMAFLSCMAAGKAAIPFPVRYGEEYCIKIFEKSNSSHIFTDHYGELRVNPVIGDSPEELPYKDTAVILFTSGSTGTPKGVMLSEENLLSNVQDISAYFPICKDDTILISRPLYHSSVLTGEFLTALCNGAKIVFSSEPFQPKNILRLFKKHEVTVFGNTPTLLSTLSRFVRDQEGVPLRLLSVSGECMTEGMAKVIRKAFPKTEVYCGYGLSEASPRVAYLPKELFDTYPTSAGFPLSHVKLRIQGSHGRIRKANQTGELWVSGPNVMQGYLGDAEKTKHVRRGKWLRTGDLAYWDNDGMLHVQGRKDDMIIRAGMNIYPAEIENVLSSDERVRDVLAYGYEKDGTQQIGLKISGAFSTVEEVMTLCRSLLPNFQIPSQIELVDENKVFLGGKKRRNNNRQ